MVAVKLKEPQEVVDLEAVPLSANAEDVSDELLGLLSGLGESIPNSFWIAAWHLTNDVLQGRSSNWCLQLAYFCGDQDTVSMWVMSTPMALGSRVAKRSE